MIQDVFLRVANEKVGIAIVIVIPGCNSVGKICLRTGEPGFRSYILENADTPITQEAVIKGRIGFLELRVLGAISEVNVHSAIVIVVQDGHTARNRLLKVFSARVVIVGDVGDP